MGKGVAGLENGVAHLELLRLTSEKAASASLSFRSLWLPVTLLETSPSTLPSLSFPDSQVSSLPCNLPFFWPGIPTPFVSDLPFNDRCREQYPRRCDSLLHPSLEHNRLHCLPLNFLRTPFSIWTMSPFLYFCCVGVGVRETMFSTRLTLAGLFWVLLFALPYELAPSISSSDIALSVFSSSRKLSVLLFVPSRKARCLATDELSLFVEKLSLLNKLFAFKTSHPLAIFFAEWPSSTLFFLFCGDFALMNSELCSLETAGVAHFGGTKASLMKFPFEFHLSSFELKFTRSDSSSISFDRFLFAVALDNWLFTFKTSSLPHWAISLSSMTNPCSFDFRAGIPRRTFPFRFIFSEGKKHFPMLKIGKVDDKTRI